MYHPLSPVVLKSGEKVEAGVVIAPDAQWHPRLEKLLFHKDDLWRWQVTQLLTRPTLVEAFHYILHRNGEPFSHILTAESQGVGILGHVWTQPEDRGQGAAFHLMQRQIEHFRARGGRALFLVTGFDSTAYRIYRKHGFESVEPQSGVMAFFASSRQEFEAEYFAPGQAEIRPLDWHHWASASALFSGDWPGVVRAAPFRLIGKAITEDALLPAIREQEGNSGAQTRALVLQKPASGAVVGLAGWSWDTIWPEVCVADVYCHPNFWHRAGELFAQLSLPSARRVIAYVDAGCVAKQGVLQAAGFREVATLKQWLARDAAQSGSIDVVIMERR